MRTTVSFFVTALLMFVGSLIFGPPAKQAPSYPASNEWVFSIDNETEFGCDHDAHLSFYQRDRHIAGADMDVKRGESILMTIQATVVIATSVHGVRCWTLQVNDPYAPRTSFQFLVDSAGRLFAVGGNSRSLVVAGPAQPHPTEAASD